MGRTAQGVKGIELRGEDRVVGMLIVRRESQVLTVAEDGIGKRTSVEEFPLQKRGGLGTLATASGDEGSDLVSALEVVEGEEVMVVTAAGKVQRIPVSSVAVQHRRSRGRKVLALLSGDRVVEVTRASSSARKKRPSPDGSGEGPGSGERETDKVQIDLLG
jgi:DNA gyrase subunit A